MTPAFAILPATSPADLADIERLFKAYAAALDVDLCFQDFATELATLPGKYVPPEGALLIARGPTGLALGCVAMRPIPPSGTCEMKRLYIAPEARGLGLGQALVEAIIAAAVRSGHREMCLDTLPSMAQALALYERAGFRRIGPYYDTPLADTIFLARTLPG